MIKKVNIGLFVFSMNLRNILGDILALFLINKHFAIRKIYGTKTFLPWFWLLCANKVQEPYKHSASICWQGFAF